MTTEGRRQRILFIDDDDDLRQVVAEGLTNAGYAVLSASNNDDALVIFERECRSISAILCDSQRHLGHCLAEYGSPSAVHDLAGIFFFERYIRKMNPDLPVVFFSADMDTPAILQERKLDGPLVHFLFKLVPLDTLIGTLEDAIKAAEARKGPEQK